MSIPKFQAPPRIIHFSFKHLLIKCFSNKINFQRCVLGRGWTWPLWTSLDLSYGFYPISFSNISCRWIYHPSNPTISLPDWFVSWLVCPPGGLGRETHHGDCHSDWLCCWWVMPITITILITIFIFITILILSLVRIIKIMMIAMMERWQKYRKWLWCWWKLNLKELKRWLQSDMKAFIWLQFCVKQFLGLPFLDCSLSLF